MSQQVRLSKQSIAAIAPPATGRTYVRDAECRGLVLQVTPNDIRSLQLYRSVSGRPVRITLGVFDPAIAEIRGLPAHVVDGDAAAAYAATRPRLNVRQARALVSLLPSASTKPADIKRSRTAASTVTAVLDEYERLHLAPKRRPGAVERVKWARQRVERRFGATKVIDLTHAVVKRWHDELVAADGPHSANRAYELLRAAVGHHIGEGKPNPVAGIKKADEPERSRYLLAHEVPAFLAELQTLDAHWRDLFTLLLLTGARRGAVQAMQWQHVELAAGIWHLPAADAKNDKPTTVVLVPQAIELLQRRHSERPPGSGYVFPSDSESGHIESPKKAWAKLIDGLHRRALVAALAHAKVEHDAAAKLAELEKLATEHKIDCPKPDLRPHDCRRTLGSWMAGGNVSLQIVGRALGHKSAGSTEIYARLQVDPVRIAQTAAVDRLLAADIKAT
jgi:integrase